MARPQPHTIPNLVIGVRVALAFVAAALLASASAWVVGCGVLLILLVIGMDGLDGFVARRLGAASRLGGVLDITADRIVEHVFWITFAVAQQIPLWVPLVVMTRSFVVDAVRGLALAQGRTAFGAETMARSRLTGFLTNSRAMRTGYGAAKVAAFVLLGALVALSRVESSGGDVGPGLRSALQTVAWLSVLATVGLCVLRGIPVVLDGRAYLAALEPRGDEGAA